MSTRQRLIILCVCLVSLLVAGCGSSGEGGSSGAGFKYNSQGYPLVSGTYTTSLGKTTNNCGVAEIAPQILSNSIVLQDGSNIVYYSTTDVALQTLEATGFIIVEESPMSGTLLKNGNFSSSRGLTLNHTTFGNLYVNYAINGKFTPSDISGALGYTVFDDFGWSCTYQAHLTGDKL